MRVGRGMMSTVKCIIDCQVVLSRAPEGPLASHIGPFARALSKQGYSLDSIHQQEKDLEGGHAKAITQVFWSPEGDKVLVVVPHDEGSSSVEIAWLKGTA
jgi:hypothetical protein